MIIFLDCHFITYLIKDDLKDRQREFFRIHARVKIFLNQVGCIFLHLPTRILSLIQQGIQHGINFMRANKETTRFHGTPNKIRSKDLLLVGHGYLSMKEEIIQILLIKHVSTCIHRIIKLQDITRWFISILVLFQRFLWVFGLSSSSDPYIFNAAIEFFTLIIFIVTVQLRIIQGSYCMYW